MAYVETPRTEMGNATFMANGRRLEDFSVENSFVAPQKKSEDLFATVRQGRGLSLRTPTARQPFGDRRNISKLPSHAEFTPLLKSVGKNNLQRQNEKLRGGPQTPAFLKDGYQAVETPALPNRDYSGIYVDELGSSIAGNENTPLPQVASSSAQSTPLAVLAPRDSNAPLDSQGVLTLKDQENVIDKIGKENFNLKLKIHFLEEALRKAGPGYHEAALKENTDLKVDKVSMQKELARAKKTLAKAEQELEAYRQHLQDVQEKIKTRNANEGLKEELQRLQSMVTSQEIQIQELKSQLESSEDNHASLEKCQNDIDDLEAELREKERLVEDKEDEIDGLKAQLEQEKEHSEDSQGYREKLTEQADQLRETQSELQVAIESKQKAEEDLEELRDEISNRSFTRKGLTRQLEEKAEKLERELQILRGQHNDLGARFSDVSRQLKGAQEKLEDAETKSDGQNQRLRDENELLRGDRDATVRKYQTLLDRAQELEKNLQTKSEEKDLLHSRHDALTSESQALQKDIARATSRVEQLQADVEDEKQHALENDKRLRSEAKIEFDRLTEEIDDVRRTLKGKESQYISDKNLWEARDHDLQSQKAKADERAKGLQRTVDTLQESQGTLSGKEVELQRALESEKKRHQDEEAILQRQIQELKSIADKKREDLKALRSEVAEAREDLRVTERERLDLEEKVQELQDEVDVLQNGLNEDDDNVPQLDEVKRELQLVEEDRQILQEKLALAVDSLHDIRASFAQTEAEKDALRSQLKEIQGHFDDTHKLDQEKVDLRRAKTRLEAELSRLRDDREIVLREKDNAEDCLNEQIEHAASEEARLNGERSELERKMVTITRDRDREFSASSSRIKRLQAQVEQLEAQLQHQTGQYSASPDISILREDLSLARKKQTEFLQRENTLKDNLRDLKKQVVELERRAHEAEVSKLAHDSPRSSVLDSARKEELKEMRQQLSESRQLMSDFRTKSRKNEETLQHKINDLQRQEQAAIHTHAEQIETIEEELSRCREEKEAQETKAAEAINNENRLRTRVKSLEASIKSARETNLTDQTMADERKDLHDMLKGAKLESENLELQIAARDTQIKAYARREKHLVNDLKMAREERLTHEGRTISLSSELDRLQLEYDAALDKFTRKQHALEAERKAMFSRVAAISNNEHIEGQKRNSGGSLEIEQALKAKETQHQLELKGLMKQMQWLKAKFMRESSFRENLQYEKRYLNLEIDMYKSCNQIDLDLLAKMVPRPSLPAQKKPGVKAAALLIIATIRMKKMAQDWGKKKRLRDALMKKLEEHQRGSKGKSAARRSGP